MTENDFQNQSHEQHDLDMSFEFPFFLYYMCFLLSKNQFHPVSILMHHKQYICIVGQVIIRLLIAYVSHSVYGAGKVCLHFANSGILATMRFRRVGFGFG
jgi:hypothetical protein